MVPPGALLKDSGDQSDVCLPHELHAAYNLDIDDLQHAYLNALHLRVASLRILPTKGFAKHVGYTHDDTTSS